METEEGVMESISLFKLLTNIQIMTEYTMMHFYYYQSVC